MVLVSLDSYFPTTCGGRESRCVLDELDWEFLHEHPEILRRHWEMAWREGRT